MLLVLVATLVSVVVIEASLTATRHARSERDYTQQMLYIQSAGELFKDCLKQTSVVVSRTSLDYDGGEDGAFDAYDDPGEIRYSCDGVLGDVMARAVEEVETLDGDTTATAEKTVTVGGGDVPAVTVRFRMHSTGNRDTDGRTVRFEDARAREGEEPILPLYDHRHDGDGGREALFRRQRRVVIP